MQLFLFFELEYLGRLLGKHVLDVVENGVVIFDVKRTADVQGRLVLVGELESVSHRLVTVR